MNTTTKVQYTRDELLEVCERGFSPEGSWCNRDSSGAVRQLGECYALLRAGCEYRILCGGGLSTNGRTIWLEVSYDGFAHFESGGSKDNETFYLPTPERLERSGAGKDWS